MSIEITLIQEIEKHPCLYNFYLPDYNKKEILDEAWVKVAANCNQTVTDCKDKWKNIRSSFVRSLKQIGSKQKKPYYLSHYLKFVTPFLKSGTDVSTDDSQSQQMEADTNDTNSDDLPVLQAIKLEPDIEELETGSIDYEGSSNIDGVDTERSLTHPRSGFLRKRRRGANKALLAARYSRFRRFETQITLNRSENNAMRFFLMSLLPEFETMNEEQIRTFKIKVMMLIDDIKSRAPDVRQHNKFTNDRLQKRLINLLLKNLEKND